MPQDIHAAQMIGLDWGTSSLRAYLLGSDGQVLAENSLPLGIMPVRQSSAHSDLSRAFGQALLQATGHWIASAPHRLPIVAAGMIGSAQGWQEVPYLRIPFDVRGLGLHLAEVAGSGQTIVHLVPGLLKTSGLPNVMRGEETQLLGIWIGEGSGDMLVCLPGTHSKWCFLRDCCIEDFETFITGELYAAVREHTIIGQTMADSSEELSPAFDRGVEVAMSDYGRLGELATIFSVRSLKLAGQLSAEEQPDYLSGLLIGHEIRGVIRWLESKGFDRSCPPPIKLSGSASLCIRYQRALASCGLADTVTIPNASAIGLWEVAVQAKLVHAPDTSVPERGTSPSC